MSALVERISNLAKREGITIGTLERKIGASKGVLSRAIQFNTDIQAKWLEKIVENYPQYALWLLTGRSSDPIEQVANRLSDVIRASELGEVANALGVSLFDLSNFTNNLVVPKKPFDYVSLLERYPEINYEWLLTGHGSIFDSYDDEKAVRLRSYEDQQYRRRVSLFPQISKPLVPNEFIDNLGSFDFSLSPVENYYTVNEFSNADFLTRMKDASMMPKYKPLDIIACKRIKELSFWQWGKTYALYTKSQGFIVKRIEQDPKGNPAFIQCVSEDPSYKPFFVHEDEIVSIALVLGAVILE